MDQRRVWLAIGLSLVVIFLYQELVIRRYQPPAPPAGVEMPAPAADGRPAAATGNAEPEPPPVPLGKLAAEPDPAPPVTVETDRFRIAITPRGARLASLQLIDFRRDVAAESPPLDLIAPGPVLPLTLQVGDLGSDARVEYTADKPALAVHGSNKAQLVFAGDAPGGGKIEKRFEFTGDGYLFGLQAKIDGGPKIDAVGLVLTPIATAGAGGGRTPGQEHAVALVERKTVEKGFPDLEKEVGQDIPPLKNVHWAGFSAQYFAIAALPADGEAHAVMTIADGTPLVRVDNRAGATTEFDVFAGPKDHDVLAAAGHDLDRVLDFGWFWFVAVPLLRALRLLHGVLGNYGVAIIVLTALVKLATTPLTQTTFRNMREMQKLKPQIDRLREQHKDDQMTLQKEMMELYKRHHVNPLAGCLPMVLQLPIFVGLYNTLLHAIELRHAPFMLWINDLSAPDRLMVAGYGIPVLTLLMGASMFLQQWLSPQQGDPTQQRMMMFMPLVFTYMFTNFPAGLVLYWLVNNVLTIAQQYFVIRQPGTS